MTAPHLKWADEVLVPPPVGSPYSVAIPGTEEVDRSATYRHWRFKDELVETLDPKVYLPVYGAFTSC